MTRLTRFSEGFWGAGFTSTAGLDALVQRMYDGKKQSKELEEYFRQRARIESTYSQDLSKLYKSLKMKDVVGTLEKTWNTLKGEVERMAEYHSRAGVSFQKQSEELKRFSEVHNTKKKQLEEHVKKYQHNKNSLYNKCMNNKKSYNSKCLDRDTAKNQFEANRQSVLITAKDLEKSRIKMEKTEEDKSKADLAYQSSLDALEHARMEWEKEMEMACETFQSLEEERISYMREDIWKSTNIDSLTALQFDEDLNMVQQIVASEEWSVVHIKQTYKSCENIRLILEMCEVGEDISLYIEKYKTGEERPAKIEYEDYYGNVSSEQNNLRHNRSPQPLPTSAPKLSAPASAAPAQHPVRPAPPRSRPPDNSSFYVEDPMYSTIESNARVSPGADSMPGSEEGLYHTLEKRDDMGAVVSPISYCGMFTVIHPYVAKNASELTVTTGLKVILVRSMPHGFIQVVEEGTKKFGLIPADIVRKCDDSQRNEPACGLLIDF